MKIKHKKLQKSLQIMKMKILFSSISFDIYIGDDKDKNEKKKQKTLKIHDTLEVEMKTYVILQKKIILLRF